jgi:adenylosuccinate lyase
MHSFLRASAMPQSEPSSLSFVYHPLDALSPLDGRYRAAVAPLAAWFCERSLMQQRARVEIEYFIALCELRLPQLKAVPREVFAILRLLYNEFTLEDAKAIKALEKTTNHDVKALEYWLRERIGSMGVFQNNPSLLEFIHFGLTSQDVNNTATPLMLQGAMTQAILPEYARLLQGLTASAEAWKRLPMLARTHGQPASPTSLGKEIKVFAERLQGQLSLLRSLPYPAKFGGATGNFNAHSVAYPDVDWANFADHFVNQTLGLKRTRTTTQIEPYDGLAALFDAVRRCNVILLDLCRDVWAYISLGYFTQTVVAGEVGSSAMPHKVNPIDFENAEGNLGLANAYLDHLSNKLPVSRLQRDLTDSTVLRNLGIPLGHTLIALKGIQKGLGKLSPNPAALSADLDANWAVLAEAIQTVLRREGVADGYGLLKSLTRTGRPVDQATLIEFIVSLPVSTQVKAELAALRPETYTGTSTE